MSRKTVHRRIAFLWMFLVSASFAPDANAQFPTDGSANTLLLRLRPDAAAQFPAEFRSIDGTGNNPVDAKFSCCAGDSIAKQLFGKKRQSPSEAYSLITKR